MKILIEESVLRQALETFTHCYAETDRRINERAKLLVELRTAIEELEKAEPVCYAETEDGEVAWDKDSCFSDDPAWFDNPIPLYLHPAQSRDSIIEECAEVCDKRLDFVPAAAIRELKGKK